LESRWPELRKSVNDRLFLTFGDELSPSLLIDLQDERAVEFLNAAWQLYLTGTVYGIESYTLDQALRLGLGAGDLKRSLEQREFRAPQTEPASDTAEESLVGSGSE
jgi:hypothetical protein